MMIQYFYSLDFMLEKMGEKMEPCNNSVKKVILYNYFVRKKKQMRRNNSVINLNYLSYKKVTC